MDIKNLLANKIPSKQFLEIFFFGIISGLPFSILYTALITFLVDGGYSLSVVTTIAVSRMPYAFKYIWAPVIDKAKIPFLHKFGRRKSWMILTSIVSSIILVILSTIDAKEDFNKIYILSIILGFSSASYDIAYDAFRIDSVSDEKQGYAVACTILGYRIGSLFASAGSLYFSHLLGWSITFLILSSIFIIAIFYIPFLKEPYFTENNNMSLKDKITDSVVKPFTEFFSRQNSFLILLAVVLYKAGDVLLGFVSTPFYLELGYTKPEIASVVKVFGLFATIGGTFIGAQIIAKIGNINGLIICGLIQGLVNVIFIWLHYAPVEWSSLFVAIVCENIGAGAGTVALSAYLSALCNKSYSATQFALLTSFAALLNSTISIKAGWMVKEFGWDNFFLSTVLISIPALIIFWYIKSRDSKSQYNRTKSKY